MFEKNKSLRVASERRTKFSPQITTGSNVFLYKVVGFKAQNFTGLKKDSMEAFS